MIIVATSVTMFYKISVHSVAAGGMIGILLMLNNYSDEGALLIPTVVGLIVAGGIMSARLELNAHSMDEVISGAVTGFVIGLGGMFIFF